MYRAKIADRDRLELRKKLDDIAGTSIEDVAHHRQHVEALNAVIPHGIKYIEDGGGHTCDCMQYMLEIPADLVSLAGVFHEIIDEFFGVALPRLLDQAAGSENSKPLVIVYFNDGKAKHIGHVKGDRIISKWGKNPVYEHGITEVPASYGDEYELFKRPSVQYITNKFIQFVRRHCRYNDFSEIFEDAVIENGYPR